MKANFKLISTLLIIFLTVLLISIVISYYNSPVEVLEYPSQNFADTNHEINKVISENVSGEIISSEGLKVVISGEHSGEVSNATIIPEVSNDKKEDTKKDQVIITSEDTMTNKEKREILTELDNALMDLLDVVDKVQTIDETRLITGESGVQE